MQKFTNLLGVACLTAYSINASAQTDTLVLKDVTINSNRIQTRLSPSAVITRKQISLLPGTTPANWLAMVSGVDIRQRGPEGVQADIGIRGGSFDQTLMLLNGMKLSDPQTGHHMFNMPLTNEAIEQIEVIKTGASRIYGINALSGAVNMVTKVPEKNMLYVGAFGGDFGLYGLKAGAVMHYKNVCQHVSFSKSSSSGYLPNTDFNLSQLFYQATAKFNKSSLNLTGGHTDRSFGARGFYVANPTEYETIQTSFAGMQHEYKHNRFKLKTQGYYRYNQDHYIYIRSNPGVFQNRHFSHVIGAEIHATYQSKIGETGIGFDSRFERLKSSNLGKRERDIFGVFIEHRFSLLNQKLILTPGLYFNQYANDKSAFFPGVDAYYKIKPKWVIFASVDKGMRLPTFTDLYYNGPSNIGNALLAPEQALSSEFGAKYTAKSIFVSASLFQRTSNNLIDWARTDVTQKWQPLNLNKVTLSGFETNINKIFNGPINQIQAGYTFIDADASASENYQSRYTLSNIKHQAMATIGVKWHKFVQQTITIRHVNRLAMNDYTLFDGKLLFRYKQFNVFAETSNLFNTKYLEAGFVQMPGRWFKVGFDIKLNYRDF
jgi:iron complex outermembrane receptor protein